jgi:ATP-dependent RNA helicase TDRD9
MKNCRIVITNPRKIGAKSIAKRVCEERNWKLGSICGYKVSLDSQVSKITKLIYVTTGYLLEQIINNTEALELYTHIIIDEIHDREMDTDLIILLLKISLMRKYQGKIILMSATLKPDLYVNYFRDYAINKHIPVLNCKIKMHSVKEWFLDDKLYHNPFHFPSYSTIQAIKTEELQYPDIHEDLLKIVYELLVYFDHLEFDAAKVNNEPTVNGLPCNRGTVLIFAPGFIYKFKKKVKSLF